jgi:transaldolase
MTGKASSRNPIRRLTELGQSPWLDLLGRDLIRSGKLDHLIADWGIRGITSNPKIFADSITKGDAYREQIATLAERGLTAADIVERVIVDDVREAAGRLRSVFDASGGRDGFVSVEVSPREAHDAERTIAEARRLWSSIARPNVFVKVPATVEGLVAIRQLISEGINVNITLLFGLRRYQEVIDAYMSGLEDRVERGDSIGSIESVASFFVSRIDSMVDKKLDQIRAEGNESAETAHQLRGETAIACAKVAYQIYREAFQEARFSALHQKGARPQRLLWGSTSTKDPKYSDVKYVDALIGPETVNTIPLETLEAYRDHGRPALRLQDDLDRTKRILAQLAALGIDMDEVSKALENEGVQKFAEPFDELLQSVERQLREAALRSM